MAVGDIQIRLLGAELVLESDKKTERVSDIGGFNISSIIVWTLQDLHAFAPPNDNFLFLVLA